MRRRIAGSTNNSTLTAPYAAFFAAVVALLVLLAAPTIAQESSQDEYDPATGSRAQIDDQDLEFAPGIEVQTISRAKAKQPTGGPLVGTRVNTLSTDDDRKVEVITIPGTTCRAEPGASFDLRDEDGTQATFTDRVGGDQQENVQIKRTGAGLRVTSDEPNSAGKKNNIVPVNERGADDALDTGGLRIVSSTDITCRGNGASNTPSASQGPNGAAVAAADKGSEAVENLLALDCDDLLERLRDREEGQYADRGFATPAVEARIDECREQEVIDDSDTGDDLPDTGGLPLLGIAVLGIAAVFAGASVIRGVGRRE